MKFSDQRRRGRRTAIVAAMACVVGISATPAAEADPGVGVGISVGVSINGVLDGVNQTLNASTGTLLGFLTAGLCKVANALLPPPLNTLVCDVSMLQYTIHTVYKKPGGGEVVRDTTALALVPALVDMTGDGIPDALAVVTLSSLNQITLQIDKLATAPANLPAQAELIVRDPTNVQSPSRFSFGYDQRTTSIPTKFKTTATLKALSPLQVNVGVTQKGADTSLTLVASMFQQLADGSRHVGVDARVGFVPGPATMSYDLTFGDNHQHLTAKSSTPTTVTADVGLHNDADDKTIHARIDKLPAQADVDMTTIDATHRTVTYNGSAPIGQIDFLYNDIANGTILAEAAATVKNLPLGVTFTQTGAKSATVTTQGGPIGLVEGGFATGLHVIPVAGTESGARVFTGGGTLSIAARLRGLTSVLVDASGPYHAELKSTTQPLHVVVADADAVRLIDATVQDLPAHLDIVVDPDNGKVVENGFGQPIDSITVDATSFAPFFSRARHLHADLTGIPANFVLDFAHADGAFSANLNHGIDKIIASVDDGLHSVSLPGPDSGLAYVDRPDAFAAKVKVFGLKAISFSSDPTTVSVQTAGGHVFDASADLDIPVDGSPNLQLTAAAKIKNLPSLVTVSLPKNGNFQHVTYTASDTIDELHIDVSSPTAFFQDETTGGAAKRIHADLFGIPMTFDLVLATVGGITSVTTDHPVDRIDFAVDDGVHTVGVPATLAGPVDSGVGFRNLPGELAIAGRIYGLKGILFQSDPVQVDVQTAGGHVFDADVQMTQTIDDSGTPLSLAAEVDQLPARVTVGITKGNGTTIDYDGHGQTIDRIEAQASGPLFFGKSHYVYGKITDVPTKLQIVAGAVTNPNTDPPTTSLFTLNTFFQTIGHIELQALENSNSPKVAFPLTVPHYNGSTSEAPDGVVYKDLLNSDLSQKEWTLALQLSGVRGAGFQLDPNPKFQLDVNPDLAQTFGVNIQTQTEAVVEIPNTPPTPLGIPTAISKYSGYVDTLPENLTLNIKPSEHELIDYSAGSVVDDLFFKQESLDGGGQSGVTGPELKVRLRDVPLVLNVCVASGPEAVGAGGCGRSPRPASWPAANGQAGDRDGDHTIVLNADDAGTSNGADPVTIDAYICLTPKNGDCRQGPDDDPTNGAVTYVRVDNFKFHNLYFDTYVTTCTGLLVCGHMAMDTRGQDMSGDVKAFTSEPGGIQDVIASLDIPSGFHANNRYTNFSDESFLTGSWDNEYGSVNCPSGTSMPIHIDLLGGGTLERDFAGPFFCGDIP